MSLYCTPVEYCDQFGTPEAVMLLQDESHELTQEALVAVALGNEADVDAQAYAVAQDAWARLVQALTDVSRLMDGYLRGALSLPLSAEQIASTPLKSCCAELARCYLMDDADNATELAEKRCEAQRKWLREVNNGTVKLFADAASASSANSGMTRHGVSQSLTDWTGYGV